MRNFSTRPRDDGRRVRHMLASRLVPTIARFDDEVAIDFPSLRSTVERMRARFDSDAGDTLYTLPLSAEVRLSAREAFRGATVPIEVPVRRLCALCGGRGEIWSERCNRCGGTGDAVDRHPVRLVVPPRVQHGDRFSLSLTGPLAPPTYVEVRVVLC